MILILLVIWGAAMTCLARIICQSWLNHLSLYTFIWTLSLGTYELHWIRYNSISGEAWLYVFMAWIALYLGTAVVMVRRQPPPRQPTAESLRRLKNAIVLLSVGGLCSCVELARQVMRDVDPNLLVAVTVGAPKIYAAGFEETGEFTGIPYLGFLPFAASALAGAYAARRGRMNWICLFPLLVATITGVLSVSRWAMLLSGALFLVSYCLTPKFKPIYLSRFQKGLIALVCAGGIVFSTVSRIDLASSLGDQSSTLNEISDWVPVAPSLYFYLSGPPVGLSAYLRDPGREANLAWGRYTFASVYRFLSKLGLATHVPFHQEFYSTPEPINTCTYLREAHSDFGVLGVFFVPFLLGLVAGWLSSVRENLARMISLAFIYVVILFSFSNLVAATGQWFQGFLVSLIASVIVERVGHRDIFTRAAGPLPGIMS
jgi:oligosaccharide repeat unit polymerase